MTQIYTVDASVFLNAFNPIEIEHDISVRFLDQVQEQNHTILVPALLFAEVAAGIARGQNNTQLGINYAKDLAKLSYIMTVDVTEGIGLQAAGIAARYRIRGCDAVYVAIAHRFNTVLVTRDNQQRERAGAYITARHPADLLA